MTVKEKVHDKPHARFCMFFCSFRSHQQMSLLITDCEMQHMLALFDTDAVHRRRW